MYTGSSQPPSEASSEPSCSAGAAVCFVCKRLIKGELNPQSVVDEACKASRQPLPSFPFLSSLCLSSFATPSPGEWRVCGWRSKVGFLAAAQVCSFPPPLLSHLMISSTRHLSSWNYAHAKWCIQCWPSSLLLFDELNIPYVLGRPLASKMLKRWTVVVDKCFEVKKKNVHFGNGVTVTSDGISNRKWVGGVISNC